VQNSAKTANISSFRNEMFYKSVEIFKHIPNHLQPFNRAAFTNCRKTGKGGWR
jgi:hypothetical protein